MTKAEILKIYFELKDEDGLSHNEIKDAFLDPENTGGAPIDIDQELQQLKNLSPEQMGEMTSDAYAEPEDETGKKIWEVSQQALQMRLRQD